MAYEVIKRVGERAYRYEVSSYRDPATGKSKGTWKYLGRYLGPREPAPLKATRHTRATTRERLLNAFVTLLQSTPFEGLTVAALARHARVTQATFYRHFPGKRALRMAALVKLRAQLSPPKLSASSDPNLERRKIRALIRRRMTHPSMRSGLVRAMLRARFDDPQVSGFFEDILRERRGQLRAYITELNAQRLGYDDDPAQLTEMLLLLGQGLMNEISLRKTALSHQEIELFANVVARILLR